MSTTRKAKRRRVAGIADSLKGLKWHGVVITWSSGPDGSVHKHSVVTKALEDAGLDPKVSRELLPRHAFARAARKLSEERVIKVFKQDETDITFQFTREHLNSSQWEYRKEAFVVLNKMTGDVSSDDSDLAAIAQSELDHAMETRATSDITRTVQRLFDEHADLIPMRDSGGVYFVPQEYADFVNRVESFLNKLGGRIDKIPVPEGTAAGDQAIQNAVAASIDKVVGDHMEAVKGFEVNTRKDTIERVADKIKATRVRIEAYAHYLGERQKDCLQKIKEANQLLKDQVETIGGGAKPYSSYDWDTILDGKVHKLEEGEDYLGKVSSFLSRARSLAKERGMRLRSSVLDNGKAVVIQAMPKDK